MKVSLIVTTYNWKEALAVVLQSIIKQNTLPYEVIIADDGSREDTAALIKDYAKTFPVPLIHSWQEDDGFRLARSRNKAIAKATGDYIIIIDGDILMAKDFVASHIAAAKPNFFVQGGRVLMGYDLSEKILQEFKIPTFFTKGLRNRHNTLSCPFLSRMFSKVWNSDKSTRGCNIAFWKQDIVAINGYNEAFEGWGREDSEMVIRMLNKGIQRFYLKFSGVGFHLYHKENTRASLELNDEILNNTIENKLQWIESGLDKHL
ncbi:glycosyltransferase family 2 protein [Marinomonas sp. 15G1-11]|uniref:Glycosyltransferase family 2 protein n=1 Tax=Marinomonas phaeophyticola TaxID=3004091 RepID=A0ABT4JXY4_9GAMM|nr:glycosyltransferase family 2 protein [Marinomonas sp. 15G1-11]MCZ2723261.1 glycosyltransferase family 2 protein [Marinomonas sp. 15G1-11]